MQTRRETRDLVRSFLNGALLGSTAGASGSGPTAHDFQFTSPSSEPMPLGRYKGQAVLVVNTASRCGFTPQYAKLQRLWEIYRHRGLIVVGVPCNDFGGQEPGTNAGIAEFCATRYAVTFPVAAKTHVVGQDRHPFYRWAAQQVGPLATPKWNFHKYLISPDGDLIDWFASTTSPVSRRVVAAVERMLPGTIPQSSTPQ